MKHYKPNKGDRFTCIRRLDGMIAFNGLEFICTGHTGNSVIAKDTGKNPEPMRFDCKHFRFRKAAKR